MAFGQGGDRSQGNGGRTGYDPNKDRKIGEESAFEDDKGQKYMVGAYQYDDGPIKIALVRYYQNPNNRSGWGFDHKIGRMSTQCARAVAKKMLQACDELDGDGAGAPNMGGMGAAPPDDDIPF